MTASTPTSRTDSHRLERAVQRELNNQQNVSIDSLVVRRVSSDSVCIQGVIRVEEDDPGDEIEAIVRKVAGVDSVLNHLVKQPSVPE